MNKKIREDKLLSITKMKSRGYKDDFIQDILNLDDETYAEMMEEYLDREDPFRKAKEKFAEFYAEQMGIKTELGKDSTAVLTHFFFEHQGIEKTKKRILEMYKSERNILTIQDLSKINGVAEWKIQEWIDELEGDN